VSVVIALPYPNPLRRSHKRDRMVPAGRLSVFPRYSPCAGLRLNFFASFNPSCPPVPVIALRGEATKAVDGDRGARRLSRVTNPGEARLSLSAKAARAALYRPI
jgi:hypothetical protein